MEFAPDTYTPEEIAMADAADTLFMDEVLPFAKAYGATVIVAVSFPGADSVYTVMVNGNLEEALYLHNHVADELEESAIAAGLGYLVADE